MPHTTPTWRPMAPSDLPAVNAVGDLVHIAYPEDPPVVAERLRLYPAGCRVLEAGDRLLGYVLSHPWQADAAPALNSLLQTLPDAPQTYYIHDLALLPAARGTGAASTLVRALAEHAAAAGFARMSLVSVNGSIGFWQRHGFAVADVPALAEKLRSYDDDACFMERRL